ncbi:MAG: hypothetical protein HY324_01890 [Chlamydiia bacterium]|nr:hypothetical protein [Chlamydiia bacterium]
MYRYLVFSIALLLSSCGYQWGPPTSLPLVAVPFIAGDTEGTLTSELTQALASSGLAQVALSDKAAYFIDAQIVGANNSVIGYRWDKEKLEGSEGRKTLAVEVSLREKEGGKAIFGPIQVETSVDYDYAAEEGAKNLLPFSLGQLVAQDLAEETALRPLEEDLARKVVDALFRSWYILD